MKNYAILSGSVTGSTHNFTGKPNQDFGFLINHDNYAIGMVSDGCGSAVNSQFGSILTCRIVENFFKEFIFDFSEDALSRDNLGSIFSSLEKRLLSDLTVQRDLLRLREYQVGKEYFLCTMMGFILTSSFVTVFHYGDGWYRFDGDVITTNPIKFEKNAPDYFAYKLYEIEVPSHKDKRINFQTYSLDHFKSLIISTDGIEDLPSSHIQELLTQDLYLKNPASLQRFLQKRNQEKRKMIYDDKDPLLIKEIQIENPPLKDDTTVIMIRKI